MRTIEHWIAGAPAPGGTGRRAPVWQPATGERQAEVALAGPSDVDAAVSAARKAFDAWSTLSLARRTRILFAFHELLNRYEDDLARLVAAEHGKMLDDARGEVVPAGRSSSSPAASRTCSRAATPARCPPVSTPGRCANRSGCAPGSPRSTSR